MRGMNTRRESWEGEKSGGSEKEDDERGVKERVEAV